MEQEKFVSCGVPHLIDKDMVRESVSKTKDGKVARPSGLVSEMVKLTEQARIDLITHLVNEIIVKGVISPK